MALVPLARPPENDPPDLSPRFWTPVCENQAALVGSG